MIALKSNLRTRNVISLPEDRTPVFIPQVDASVEWTDFKDDLPPVIQPVQQFTLNTKLIIEGRLKPLPFPDFDE